MNDAEYTIKNLRSCGAGNMPWTVFPREARGVVEHIDHLAAENERLRLLVERQETAFRHICSLLDHKIGSDPLHVAAVQAVTDMVMLGVPGAIAAAVAKERAAVTTYLRDGEGYAPSDYADWIGRGDHLEAE